MTVSDESDLGGEQLLLPGKLGDRISRLSTDRRRDPRMFAGILEFGFDGEPEPMPVRADWTSE